MFINFDDLFLPTLLFGTKIKPEHGEKSLKMNNQGENTQISDAIKQIVLEKREFYSKKHEICNF